MNWKPYIPVLLVFALFVAGMLLITPALTSISRTAQATNETLREYKPLITELVKLLKSRSDTTYTSVNTFVNFDKLAAKLNSRIEYVTVIDTVDNVVYRDTLKIASADSILVQPVTVIRSTDTTRHEISQHIYIAYDGKAFSLTSELGQLYLNDSTMTITNHIPLWQYGAAIALIGGAYVAGSLSK